MTPGLWATIAVAAVVAFHHLRQLRKLTRREPTIGDLHPHEQVQQYITLGEERALQDRAELWPCALEGCPGSTMTLFCSDECMDTAMAVLNGGRR